MSTEDEAPLHAEGVVITRSGWETHDGCVFHQPFYELEDAIAEGQHWVAQYSRNCTIRHAAVWFVLNGEDDVVARVYYDPKWTYLRQRQEAGLPNTVRALRDEAARAKLVLTRGVVPPVVRAWSTDNRNLKTTELALPAEVGRRLGEIPIEGRIEDAEAAVAMLLKMRTWNGVIPPAGIKVWRLTQPAEMQDQVDALVAAALGRAR